jgi:hypothetical protein
MNVISAWWRGDWKKLLVALTASAYFVYYASTSGEWHFIDYVNLIIHEAGHWIFLPFGEFMHILGGSLFQTVFPLVYVGYFYFRKDYFSASLLLFWVGQNLVNVSVYAGDAIVMQLPLLGGDSVIHDWNYILESLHVISYTPQIASCIYGAGVTIIGLAAIWAVYTSQQPPIKAL